MPAYELSLPKDTYNVKVKKRDSLVEYPIDIDSMGFTRTGEDGTVTILPLFGGDEFVGLVLEGHWKKGWDSNMDADQPFTAILDGAGVLEFEGEADVAGTGGSGWINSSLPLPLVDELELQVSMKVPVDDTGGTANRDIKFEFYLRGDVKPVDDPFDDDDYISFYTAVSEDGLRLHITKFIANVETELASGYNYTMDGSESTGDLEGVIWRIIFHDGHFGTAAPNNAKHMHVYLKQAATIVDAESATEYQVTGSPFNISDLLFDVAYPALEIWSQNITYFDSGNEAKATYIKVDYNGDVEAVYEADPDDQLLNEVELWDGDPDNGGVKVYDVDHAFTNAAYIQNGLLRAVFTELAQYALTYFYNPTDAEWDALGAYYRWYLVDSTTYVSYLNLLKIVSISPEKCVLLFRHHDSGVVNEDNYIDIRWVFERGKSMFSMVQDGMYPSQSNLWFRSGNDGVVPRWGADSDGNVGDEDLGITMTSNEDDNVYCLFDDTGDEGIFVYAFRKEPTGGITIGSFTGVLLTSGDVDSDQIWRNGASPFSLVANLFIEAEDGSYGAAGTVTDVLASPLAGANNAVQLNAIGNYKTPAGEYSVYVFTAGTDLPAGRYRAVVRAKYIDIETMNMYVWNDSDNVYRNEENAEVTKTLTAAWAYYSLVFDITDGDVTGTDSFAIVAEKSTDDTDEIGTDYVLIIPIGNGESFPQDLAHNALRVFKKGRRVVKK